MRRELDILLEAVSIAVGHRLGLHNDQLRTIVIVGAGDKRGRDRVVP
ncbi:hypothetical protein ACIPUC_00095 [Streptomyces sp. LARHCF249]